MKRRTIFALSGCTCFIFVFFIGFHTYADKGREHYEQTGEVVWDIETQEKVVAITFDDGPDDIYTNQVLDLLEEYDAKATFFVLGKIAEKHPEVILRQYEEGHELANHTYSHPKKPTLSQIEEEMRKTNGIIYSITGFKPTLFRPVGGEYTDGMIGVAVKLGYTVILWSWHQDTQDWKNPGVNKIVKKVLDGTKPGDVILFHDGGSDRTQTVEALKKILPELKKQGYKFVTISEMLEIKNKKQHNEVKGNSRHFSE